MQETDICGKCDQFLEDINSRDQYVYKIWKHEMIMQETDMYEIWDQFL